MEFIKDLVKYGLSEKEAKVYLSLLMLGSSTVNGIAEKANLVRTTTYDLLKMLREKGFVSSFELNKTLHFEAAHPKKLSESLNDKQKEIEEIIPKLTKLNKEKIKRPSVKLYEGRDGIISVFEEIIRAKKPLLAYSNNSAMIKIVPFYGPRFIKKRVKEKIPIKIISEESPTTKEFLQDLDKKELRETRIFPKLMNVEFSQYIFGDSVAIFGSNQNEPIGMIISNKEFVNSQRIIFEELWKKAKF